MLLKKVLYFYKSKTTEKPKWFKCTDEDDCMRMARMGFEVKKVVVEQDAADVDDEDIAVWY